MNNQYSTLAEAIEDLKKGGYTINFRINKNGTLEGSEGEKFGASDEKLAEFRRFEGMSEPGDSTILYALETNSGLKGTLADSYGADASELTSKLMKNVEQKNEDNS